MRGSCLVKKITESAKEIVYILCFICNNYRLSFNGR